jgi:hypothetical protein
MAEAAVRLTLDVSALREVDAFLNANRERIESDEVLLERLKDLTETHRLSISIPTPGRFLHYTIEPSYPLLEIMAEVGR